MVVEDYYVNFLWANFCSVSIEDFGSKSFQREKGAFSVPGTGLQSIIIIMGNEAFRVK